MSENAVTKKENLSFYVNILENVKFRYFFLVNLLIYTFLCVYILIFSGDLFIESVMNGWYGSEASEFDKDSFMLGFLYSFPSLFGLVGSLIVLITNHHSYYKFKVLFFIPAVVWSTELAIDILFRGAEYWKMLFYHFPAMLLCIFILLCVILKVKSPINILTITKKVLNVKRDAEPFFEISSNESYVHRHKKVTNIKTDIDPITVKSNDINF